MVSFSYQADEGIPDIQPDGAHKALYHKQSFSGHQGVVNSVAFHPDNDTVASGGEDTSIYLWSVIEGAKTGAMEGHYRSLSSVAFNPDGEILAAGGFDGTVRLYSVQSKTVIKGLKGAKGSINSLAFSPDGKKITAGCEDKSIRMWNIESGDLLFEITGVNKTKVQQVLGKLTKKKPDPNSAHECSVTAVAFRPDGLRIATGCMDKTVKMWSAISGDLKCTMRGHLHPVDALQFSHDGTLLASGSIEEPGKIDGRKKVAPSNDKTIRIWDSQKGVLLKMIHTKSYDTHSISFSPDNSLLATGGWDYTKNRNTIRLWNVDTGEMIRPFDGHKAKIKSVEFSANGRLLVSGGDDKTVKVWRVE